MPYMYCRNCGQIIAVESNYCQYCGKEQHQMKQFLHQPGPIADVPRKGGSTPGRVSSKYAIRIFIGAVIFLGLLAALFFTRSKNGTASSASEHPDTTATIGGGGLDTLIYERDAAEGQGIPAGEPPPAFDPDKPFKRIVNDNRYRNDEYGFYIEFPEGWEYYRVVNDNTLAEAVESKKGMSISISVIPFPIIISENDITRNFSEAGILSVVKKIAGRQDTGPGHIEVLRGRLDQMPAYFIRFETYKTSGKEKFTEINNHVLCVRNWKLFDLAIDIPESEWNHTGRFIYKRTMEQFKFMLQ